MISRRGAEPRCCGGSRLCDELGSCRFEALNDLTRSFPGVPAGAPGILGSPNLAQAGRCFGKILWPSATGWMVMRIIHKPVALAWRQRASAALRARAAATLPSAFVNNSHDFYPTSPRACGWHRSITNSTHELRLLLPAGWVRPTELMPQDGAQRDPRWNHLLGNDDGRIGFLCLWG